MGRLTQNLLWTNQKFWPAPRSFLLRQRQCTLREVVQKRYCLVQRAWVTPPSTTSVDPNT